VPSPTIAEALRGARVRLAASGQDAARLEAELLLCAAIDATRTALIAWPERRLEPAQAARLEALLERRLGGEPMAYILGRREFWGIELEVGPSTLIPRPDTELLVECALKGLPADAPLVCADLGTGCGAVAAALAHERARWTLIAVERWPLAAAMAAGNQRRLGLDNLLPLCGDWLTAFAAGSLDAVVSNPPYVRDDDPHLAQGDLRFEPRSALCAGADGLDAARVIAAEARHALRPGGWLALEHGWDQGDALRRLLAGHGFTAISTHRDLAGHERVTSAVAPESSG
jgi:release factor glutamine methyltransferase